MSEANKAARIEYLVGLYNQAESRRLNERERCAQIAESFPQMIPTGPGHVRQVTGKDIAAAIRDEGSSVSSKDGGDHGLA